MRRYKSYNVYISGESAVPKPVPTGDTFRDLGPLARWGVDIGHVYEEPVEALLDKLDKDGSVVRALLNATSAKGSTNQEHRVVIKPLLGAAKQKLGADNAWTQPKRLTDASAKSTADAWGQPGTAIGSDVDILFDPNSGATCSAGTSGSGCPGNAAIDTLLHELVHAVRDIQGRRNPIPLVEPGKSYTDVEEFYAILLANIDMSARGATTLRRHHADYSALPTEWSTSDGFLTDATHRKWVKEFCYGDSIDLSSQVKNVSAKFNPIRELMANPNKYRN